jgi:hypothetical protein
LFRADCYPKPDAPERSVGSLKYTKAGLAGKPRLTRQVARERTKQVIAGVRMTGRTELVNCQSNPKQMETLFLRLESTNNGQELSAELDRMASELTVSQRNNEKRVRADMLGALENYTSSRYEFGQALAAYKQIFQVERVWMKASNAIARHIGRDQRTVFRILEDYERVAGAPKPVVAAMKKEGFDPAELKNARLLGQVVDMMPPKSTPEQTQEIVRKTAALLKQNKGQQTMSEDDQIVWGLRQDIRKRLSNVPEDDKWNLLKRAIAEEAFEVWGITEPWQPLITPKAGPQTLDGRRRQEHEAAA